MKQKPEPFTIGDTTKKTINRTLVIGAALTATVILTPAAFARETHHEPAYGIRLATDIVNLVRAIVEPRPAPVIVETAPAVVEKTVIVETAPAVVATTQQVVTAAPGTVIVTGTETATVPEYSYILYEDEYIPYYEGWLYYHDVWHWIGAEARPAAPPRWKPEAHHHAPAHHKVIVLPERHRAPFPVIHHEAPRHEPAVRYEAPRREPARTVVVRPDKKDAGRGEAAKAARPDKKDAPRGETPKQGGPKKGR